MKCPVYAVANLEFIFKRLEVDITRALVDPVGQNTVDELNYNWLINGGFIEVVRLIAFQPP